MVLPKPLLIVGGSIVALIGLVVVMGVIRISAPHLQTTLVNPSASSSASPSRSPSTTPLAVASALPASPSPAATASSSPVVDPAQPEPGDPPTPQDPGGSLGECEDGRDNDGDRGIDYEDIGCYIEDGPRAGQFDPHEDELLPPRILTHTVNEAEDMTDIGGRIFIPPDGSGL